MSLAMSELREYHVNLEIEKHPNFTYNIVGYIVYCGGGNIS